MKAPADLVVDPSTCHAFQRRLDHLDGLAIFRAPVDAQQQPHRIAGGKLRSTSLAASGRVEACTERAEETGQRVLGQRPASLRQLMTREGGCEPPAGFLDAAAIVFPGLGDGPEELEELRAWKVGPAEAGAAVGGGPHPHRPAAAT